MFKELNENLSSIEGEVTKLKKAIEHIDSAKSAAQAAVNAANITNAEFKDHLLKVTKTVDSILKPHQELINATETLTKTLEAVDFPARLDKQGKEIKFLKIFSIVILCISLAGLVFTILIFYKS